MCPFKKIRSIFSKFFEHKPSTETPNSESPKGPTIDPELIKQYASIKTGNTSASSPSLDDSLESERIRQRRVARASRALTSSDNSNYATSAVSAIGGAFGDASSSSSSSSSSTGSSCD